MASARATMNALRIMQILSALGISPVFMKQPLVVGHNCTVTVIELNFMNRTQVRTQNTIEMLSEFLSLALKPLIHIKKKSQARQLTNRN
jgi:hypothetical protein